MSEKHIGEVVQVIGPLRIALRGSLSHYPSLRNLWLKGLSAVLSGMASGPCRFLISPISGPGGPHPVQKGDMTFAVISPF